jgi:hypothetical protein
MISELTDTGLYHYGVAVKTDNDATGVNLVIIFKNSDLILHIHGFLEVRIGLETSLGRHIVYSFEVQLYFIIIRFSVDGQVSQAFRLILKSKKPCSPGGLGAGPRIL